jgi:PAS domain S-box-containing protein
VNLPLDPPEVFNRVQPLVDRDRYDAFLPKGVEMAMYSPLASILSELDSWVIDQSPAALCVCRAPHGEIIRYNALAVRLWGRAPSSGERLTGAWRTRSPDGRLMPVDETPMEVVLRGGAAIRDRRMLIERQNGSSIMVTACVSPLQDEAGRLVGAISAFEEVAADGGVPAGQAMSYEELLARHRRLLDTDTALGGALDSALIGVWEYDLGTRRAVRSITHDQILGYSQPLAEWTFDTFLEHVAPEDRELIRARFDQCLAGGAGEFDCRIIRADGSPAWIWSRGRVVRDAAGAPARIVGLVMDVTRHRMAEQALDLERRRKETFVATLAHELRQPLSALLAAVEVVRLAPEADSATRATGVMKRQIAQMNRVVDDLIDATRWSQGKVTLRMQRIDVRDVIRDAARDVGPAVAECAHELVVETSSEPLWADADPQRIQQVLSNLLRNAVKYTDPGGRLSLAAERRAGTISLRVSDTGRGIEAEALTRIFDLFSQVRPSEGGGLGVGLSVVREIVALHGGRIEAQSKGPGHGSEFIVTLPLAAPPPAGRNAG